MERNTTYYKAVHYCHNQFILCNEIAGMDESFWENARFSLEKESGDPIEIFQYYLTDASESDVEFLEKSFGLLFSYSSKLGLYVLCVDHWGTSWDYVNCTCYNDEIPSGNL